MIKSPWRWFFAVLLLAILGVGGWYWQKQNIPAAQRYKLASLETGDITQSVSANGTLNPVVLVNVGTQVSGTVRKLYVDFNDTVEKGQALLELDDALLAAQVRQSEANVANARAAVDLAKVTETRLKGLLAEEYISRQEYDQAASALRSAEAQLALAKAQHDKDRVNHGNATIRSPVSGVVVDRIVDIGQTVAASFQTPVLIKIAQDLTEMRIDTSFAEADIGSLREGQSARFTVDAFPERSFEGKVQQIRLNPTNQQNVVTYNVRVTVDNPERLLLPGMTAYVGIAVAQANNALLVPNAALRYRPSKDPEGKADNAGKSDKADKREGGGKGKRPKSAQTGTVYVLDGETLRAVTLTLGISDGRNTVVVDGELKAGDKVITGENTGDGKKASSVGTRLF